MNWLICTLKDWWWWLARPHPNPRQLQRQPRQMKNSSANPTNRIHVKFSLDLRKRRWVQNPTAQPYKTHICTHAASVLSPGLISIKVLRPCFVGIHLKFIYKKKFGKNPMLRPPLSSPCPRPSSWMLLVCSLVCHLWNYPLTFCTLQFSELPLQKCT